ncbi:MAG: rRNA maturation RNase YbeY [Alphaproteobacteria bacterium]
MTNHADIAVTVQSGDWDARVPGGQDLCRRAADAAVREGAHGLDGRAVELAVVLADDDFVRTLNRTYRHQDKPTNVLSFPSGFLAGGSGDPGHGALALGDVVIALSTLCREAADQGKPIQDHLAHLVVHGVLHLLGYDHDEETEAQAMEALETRLLAGLGVADPYGGERARVRA